MKHNIKNPHFVVHSEKTHTHTHNDKKDDPQKKHKRHKKPKYK